MLKNITLIVSLLFILQTSSLLCQNYKPLPGESFYKQFPQNSVEATFGGSALFISLNYSHFFPDEGNNFFSLSLGASYIPYQNGFYTIPLGFTYNNGDGSHFFEIGGALTAIGFVDGSKFAIFDDASFLVLPSGLIGWRWHISDWTVVRANINLLLIGILPIPYPGVSIGVRF